MEQNKWESMVKQINTLYLKRFLKNLIKLKKERNVAIERKGINLSIKINN